MAKLEIGPKHCPECRTRPTTQWNGQSHPICTKHREMLGEMFETYPERQVEWDGYGDLREYSWVERVRENVDPGQGGDLDPEGRLRPTTVHDLHAAGAISRAGMLRLIDLKHFASEFNLRARVGREMIL